MAFVGQRFGTSRLSQRRGFLERALTGWSRTDLFYGISLITVLYSVVVAIRYEAAASALGKEALDDVLIEGASGDVMRQITYFTIFFLVAGLTIFRAGGLPRSPISWAYNAACFWCLISFTWAIEPAISFRRAVGMYIILIAVGWCVQSLGASKTLQVLYIFLAGILLSSFAAVALHSMPLFSFSIHPDDEADQSLIGAWRGVMLHKNVAGAVMTHSSIFFFHCALNRKKKLDWLFFGMSVVFLIMTKSKTSDGWFAVVLLAGLGVRYLMLHKAIAALHVASAAMILVFGIFGYILQDQVYAFFTNPLNLSGRIEIWQSLFPYINDHPILGSGYGSFWAIGYDSPIYGIAKTNFITQIGHSHSGYIEILLSTGVVGLSLALFALLVLPYRRFAKPIPADARLNPMLFSIWIFGMLQNFTEAQFFSPDKQSWIFVVLAITIVQTRHNASVRRDFGWLERTGWFPWTPPTRASLRRKIVAPAGPSFRGISDRQLHLTRDEAPH